MRLVFRQGQIDPLFRTEHLQGEVTQPFRSRHGLLEDASDFLFHGDAMARRTQPQMRQGLLIDLSHTYIGQQRVRKRI